MAERDTVLAVLQSDIGIAALIIVFAGFLISKGDSYQTIRGDKYRLFALGSLIPFLACAVSIWISIDGIEGNAWCAQHALESLKWVLVLSAAYAIMATIFATT